jgi:hypothetical protein
LATEDLSEDLQGLLVEGAVIGQQSFQPTHEKAFSPFTDRRSGNVKFP